MKRVRLYFGILIIYLVLLNFVSAGSVGISPANYKVFFEPNLQEIFSFRVSNSDIESSINIYVEGDLSEYVELSETSLVGRGELIVHLNLPEKIEKPGKHRIMIGATEVKDIEGGFGGLAAIQAPIDVYVPYPGKYAESTFEVSDINVGEEALYTLTINNLGTEDISISPYLEIFSGETLITSETIGDYDIESKHILVIEDLLNTSTFEPGNYEVRVSFNYGTEINLKDILKVGYFYVNISDYSNQFYSHQINKFNIEVEGLWNLPMDDVYGKVVVTQNGVVLDDFKTPSVILSPWDKVNLTGFFDASNIDEGKYTANIQIFYGNETNGKLVTIYANDKPMDMIWFKIGGVVIGIIVIVLIIFIFLIVKIWRLRKNVSKKR